MNTPKKRYVVRATCGKTPTSAWYYDYAKDARRKFAELIVSLPDYVKITLDYE